MGVWARVLSLVFNTMKKTKPRDMQIKQTEERDPGTFAHTDYACRQPGCRGLSASACLSLSVLLLRDDSRKVPEERSGQYMAKF